MRNRSVKQKASPRRQRGLVLVLVTLGMVVLVGFAALGIDINHALLNQSRLQNAVDAAALAAATIADELDDTAQATTAAKETLTAIATATGNSELDFDQGTYTFTYTNDPEVFPDPSFSVTEDIYVRVSVSNYSLANYFLQVFGIAKKISASAVAGPSASSNQVCNLVPMAVCNKTGNASNGWGYGDASPTTLKLPSNKNSPMGAGNFQLLDFGSGGSGVRKYLAGEYEGCINIGDSVTTKPGNTVGPVGQGLNSRFGDYGSSVNVNDHPPDIFIGEPNTLLTLNSDGSINNPNDWGYDDYQSGLNNCLSGGGSDCGSSISGANPTSGRRILAVPVINCSDTSGGKNNFTVAGVGCFFLLQKAPTNNGNKDGVFGEFLRDCTSENSYNDGSSDADGPYKIVLYEDPLSEDS